MRKVITEFVGTGFLVAVVGLVTVQGVPQAAWVIGMTLAVLVYMGGHVSGANYNPAVSLALVVRGKLGFIAFVPYLLAQFAGGFVGTAIVYGLLGRTFAVLPAEGVEPLRAMLAEALFTGLLCLVVLHTATVAKTANNSYHGLAIGMSVTIGALCVGGISGGGFNPAVVLGPNVLHTLVSGDHRGIDVLGIYLVGPVFGALIATGLFAIQTGEGLFVEEVKEEEEKPTQPGRGRLRIAERDLDAA